MKNPGVSKKQNAFGKVSTMFFAGLVLGFLAGQRFRVQTLVKWQRKTIPGAPHLRQEEVSNKAHKIWVPSNVRGAESLPPGIIASESDLFPRRLYGLPSEDLTKTPKYLVAFTVGFAQKNNIDLAVKKFSNNFTIVLFHYDGQTTEWNEFEWSKNAIHVSVQKQAKWWYAKRFLHPDIVAPYDYIFLWDEDLGVEHFDAEEYIRLVKKHGLEISQPAVESGYGTVWDITKRKTGYEVHKELDPNIKPLWCREYRPPCAGFVEIMAPVFSKNAWRCAWHMIQNDLVHGWGLDKAFGRCVEPPQEKMGIVDDQWVVHQHIPSLGNQGEEKDGQSSWQRVNNRCKREEKMFANRLKEAEKQMNS